MSKLTTVFENYDDAEFLNFCKSQLDSGCDWYSCVHIDESTGDVENVDCEEAFKQFLEWGLEFYEVDDINDIFEVQPNSYMSAYETDDSMLVLISSHPV